MYFEFQEWNVLFPTLLLGRQGLRSEGLTVESSFLTGPKSPICTDRACMVWGRYLLVGQWDPESFDLECKAKLSLCTSGLAKAFSGGEACVSYKAPSTRCCPQLDKARLGACHQALGLVSRASRHGHDHRLRSSVLSGCHSVAHDDDAAGGLEPGTSCRWLPPLFFAW